MSNTALVVSTPLSNVMTSNFFDLVVTSPSHSHPCPTQLTCHFCAPCAQTAVEYATNVSTLHVHRSFGAEKTFSCGNGRRFEDPTLVGVTQPTLSTTCIETDQWTLSNLWQCVCEQKE